MNSAQPTFLVIQLLEAMQANGDGGDGHGGPGEAGVVTEPGIEGDRRGAAGEDRYHVKEDVHWVNGVNVDDSAYCIEEDPESDDEDFLELEYHPSFVNNVEKRRQR